jgi:hypothetical protein
MLARVKLFVTDNGSLADILPSLALEQKVNDDCFMINDRHTNSVVMGCSVALACLAAVAQARKMDIVDYIKAIKEANEEPDPVQDLIVTPPQPKEEKENARTSI